MQRTILIIGLVLLLVVSSGCPTPTPDRTLPTISISSPSSGQTFTTPTITVRGTASDDKALSRVEVRVGTGNWITAIGTTSWSATVTLSEGSNTIEARAIDTNGNIRETSVIVDYTPTPTPLTTHTATDELPAWSPDGKKIAFHSGRTGNIDIWVMDSDGGNLRQLTTHTAGDGSPAWSLDGKKIAFHSDRTGNEDIWVSILE